VRTPNIDIEEGYITIEHSGRKYPAVSKQPGRRTIAVKSTIVTIFTFLPDLGLRATDLSVVYGVLTEETG